MSREDLWKRAAEAMATDDDPRWHAVGTWLRQEALVQDGMEPFAELLNLAIEKEGGPSSYIRFGRKPDGDMAFLADTNEPATAVALAYLGETPTTPTNAETTEGAGMGGGA